MTSRLFLALSLSLAAATVANAQSFIATNRTIAGGNPINENYNGSTVYFGASGYNASTQQFIRVSNLQADVIDPASFGYSDQTGGGLNVLSNSVVRVSGGTAAVTGGTGAPGGGLYFNDTSQGFISRGNFNGVNVSGTAAGAGGATANVSGGIFTNGRGPVSVITNGTLNMTGGTINSTTGQAGISCDVGSVVNISGGMVIGQATSGPLGTIMVGGTGVLNVTGGTISAKAGSPNAVIVDNATTAASLMGGTISGVQARRSVGTTPTVQMRIGGSVTINGGVFAGGDAAIDVLGGTFTGYAGDASFLTLGNNNINFFGTNLALSAPTAGSVFIENNIAGNFYTFTSGFFQSGQSAVGLRLFDATPPNGSTSGNSGGFTLNPSAVGAPEPCSLALLALAGTPAIGIFAWRRR